MFRRRTYILIDSGAIGHFVRDFDSTKAQISYFLKSGESAGKIIFVARGKISNRYFLDLIARADVLRTSLFSYLVFRFRRFFKLYNRELWNLTQDKGVEILKTWHLCPPIFLPHNQDINFVKAFIEEKLDITRGLITLVVRDAGYDYSVCEIGGILPMEQLYRNTPIQYLEDSVNYFTSLGYAVIRLGRHSITRMDKSIKNFYDYSIDFVNHDDRIDVVVPYLSDLVFTSGSGIDEIASFFRTPVYRFNLAPVGTTPMSCITRLIMPQDYIRLDTLEKLPLETVLCEPLYSEHPMRVFSTKNIGLSPKTSAELLRFAQISIADFQILCKGQILGNERKIIKPLNVPGHRELTQKGLFIY